MIPKYRTAHYAVWRACERAGVLPPDVKPAWDDCNVEAQAELIAFNQIREQEETELQVQAIKAHAALPL